MHHLKILRFSTFVVFALFQALSVHAAEALPADSCAEAFARASAPRNLYQPIVSSDLDFLRTEARFAEGPAPQKNMAVLTPADQFRFNNETKAILELKKRLIAKNRDRIIAVQRGQGPAVLAAVREQFQMMLKELPEKSPQIFSRDGDTLANALTGDRLSAKDLATSDARLALEKLGSMVPDDLVFMKKKGDDYVLIGGNLAFPTHWSIGRALGATISEIHGGLAGDPEKAKAFSAMINRVLDRTLSSPEVVRRNNWFLELDPRYPLPDYLTTVYPAPEELGKTIGKKNYKKAVYVRTERQTLRGLPESRVVTFGLQPMVFSVDDLVKDGNLAANLVDGIRVKLLPTRDNPEFVAKIARYIEQDIARAQGILKTHVVSAGKVNDTSSILRIEKPEDLKLVPGEAIRVTLNTPTGHATRTLSLASSPDQDYLEFAVKDSDSDFKQAFRALKPGDAVRIEPTGTSLEFKPEKPAVMIAGGIGITPFRSFIQYVKDQGLKTRMWLLYGNRDQIAFKDELDQATAKNSKLKVTHVLSGDNPDWKGERGRVDRAFLEKTVPTMPKDAIYYVVASPQMANDTREALNHLGVPNDRISIEAFPYPSKSGSTTNPKIDPVKAPNEQTVCYCHSVSAGALRSAIKNGTTTLDELKTQTKAATGCGGCECNVMGILQCELAK